MSTPTPPKQHTEAATQTESALAFADQLIDYAVGLKRELKGYGDPNTIGRDTAKLTTFFSDMHRCELHVAQAMGVDWQPSNSS